jgi:hypothetical protein
MPMAAATAAASVRNFSDFTVFSLTYRISLNQLDKY